jgi:hypothetical protein
LEGGIRYGPPSVAALRRRGPAIIGIHSEISLYRHAGRTQKVRPGWPQKGGEWRPNIVIRRTLPYSKVFLPLDFPASYAAMPRPLIFLAIFCLALARLAPAQQPQNDSDEPPASSDAYAEIVKVDQPVAYWRFEDGKGAVDLIGSTLSPRQTTGAVKFGHPGPRRDKFPLFDGGNQSAFFDKPGSLRFDDPGEASAFDFTSGDAITLEAWISPTRISSGQQVYIVGKGRTGNKGFAADNQNWALRLVGKDGGCHISFLFRDADNRPADQAGYHRWTSDAGFAAGSGWHFVAVTYRFGEGDSVRGFVDGRETKGAWDLGGKSDAAPVVDNDQVWIGAGNGTSTSNAFLGGIDEAAVYRTALPAERIAARWKINQPKAYVTTLTIPDREVVVEVLEGMPDNWTWDFVAASPSERFSQRELAFVEVPKKYNSHGIIADRSSPFVLWAHANVELPAGKQRLLLRSRSAARLYIDEVLVVENPFQSNKTDGHNAYQPVESKISPHIRPLQPGDHEELKEIELTAGKHRLRLEVFVGGKKHRPEVGETSVSIAPAGSDDFWVLGFSETSVSGGTAAFPLTDASWQSWERDRRAELVKINQQRRAAASAEYAKYWNQRHEWARQQVGQAADLPYKSIDDLIDERLKSENVNAAPLCDDYAFVRRIYLDIVGITPTAEQVAKLAADSRPDKRSRLIDELLEQSGWADNWVGYWQDALAENPNIVNPTLNNTGPFRWWIYEALLDNKPLDRFATELILMEGSARYGGTAGFAVASENDAPLAAKAQNIGLAFLAFDMRCARCHDAPSHDFSQEDLFNLAAMLHRGEQTLPKTSTIPGDDKAHASLMVKVTLKPGQKIAPRWPFGHELPGDLPRDLLENPTDAREELALRITSPKNPRFAQVMVNRLWQRYFGRGIVEPVDDWETAQPTHPQLLDCLSRELVAHDYDAKHIARLIFNSRAYQRVPTSDEGKSRLFAAPLRRRMTAEQVLDSLLAAAGKEAHTEEMNVDVDSSRLETSSINLGLPTRAWRFTTMGNERDRPSLSLPAAQTAVTLLETFGWRSTRQDPLTYREKEPSVLQPAILANGIFAKRAAQISEDSAFVAMALAAETRADFVEALYRQILSRPPTTAERDLFVSLLGDDFSNRKTGEPPGPVPGWPARDGVSWSNHLQTKSNEIRIARQKQFEKGDPPTAQLKPAWRERAEDMVWALVNSPEFVWIP